MTPMSETGSELLCNFVVGMSTHDTDESSSPVHSPWCIGSAKATMF